MNTVTFDSKTNPTSILNAALRAAIYPSTVSVPSDEELSNLTKNDVVKLSFKDSHFTERLRVKFKHRNSDKTIVGVLIDRPKYIHHLILGDEIHFEDKHVFSIGR